jgi:hypothetical protein
MPPGLIQQQHRVPTWLDHPRRGHGVIVSAIIRQRHRQIGMQHAPAGDCQIDICWCQLDRAHAAAGALGDENGGARAAEGFEHQLALIGVSPHQELRQHHRKHRGVLRLDVTAFKACKAQDVVGDPEVLHRQASMLVFGDGAVSRARPAALMAAL